MEQVLLISSILLWIVLVLNLLLTLAVVRRLARSPREVSSAGGGSGLEGPTVGQPAPNFTAETLQGQKISLSTYAGRPVAFLFVSPGCPPCRTGMPNYEAWGAQARRAGADLVLVCSSTPEAAQKFADELHITLPVLIAQNEINRFAEDYSIPGTPWYCLVDEEGIVSSTGAPILEAPSWKAVVESWNKSHDLVSSSVAQQRGGV